MLLMNLANQITLLRIGLAFVCIWLIVRDTFISMLWAFIVFIAASLTDYFDGLVARKFSLVSDLGKILDPIADKILIIGVFLAFLDLGAIHVWIVTVILLRELIITSLRFFCLNKGIVLEAKILGKHKTVSQIAGVILIFITLLIVKAAPDSNFAVILSDYIMPVVLWYIIIITVYSGAAYLWDNRRLIETF